jgi:ABC-type cobalamin transport system ATPase subunit
MKGVSKVKKLSTLGICLVLTSTFLATTLLAESHRIELIRPGEIGGQQLKAGKYKLVLNGQGTAEIYRGRKLLAKASVEVLPLGDRIPRSISQTQDGELKEIRLKKERVVFIESQAIAQNRR